jgi:hypothetical protein
LDLFPELLGGGHAVDAALFGFGFSALVIALLAKRQTNRAGEDARDRSFQSLLYPRQTERNQVVSVYRTDFRWAERCCRISLISAIIASLLLDAFPRMLVGLMAADQAARTSSEQSVMASIVPRHPAHDGTL